MQLIPVDQYQDLFAVSEVFDAKTVEHILSTDWINLPYQKQPGQESWPRRKVITDQLCWHKEFEAQMNCLWKDLETQLDLELEPYQGTAFWLDEPGFTCPIHTDGEMPGSLHVCWIGSENCGTVFYHSKRSHDIRHCTKLIANQGYVMINLADSSGYRHLQWHGMLCPVPSNSYRLTSYTWLRPIK